MTTKEFEIIRDCLRQAHCVNLNGRYFVDRDNALVFIENLIGLKFDDDKSEALRQTPTQGER